MKISWKELDAARLAEPYMDVLFPIMDAKDAGQLKACMERYARLPTDVQGALGYMRCLLESGFGDTYSAYGQYSIEAFRHHRGNIPYMRLPLRFIGWGGEHNEIGPAYEIDRSCYTGAAPQLFYTDDDIREDPDATATLARYIGQASSGITEVQAARIMQLRTMNGDISTAHWCVTFRLANTARKEIAVNGKAVSPEVDKAVFLLPKAGEFDCVLGEIVNGEPDNAFVLARHSYCMK